MQEYLPDSLDLRVVHALEVEPRASWAAVAAVVGADPATVSRRWRRLEEQGLAWCTGVVDGELGEGDMALVEIECVPALRDETATALVEDPEVMILDLTVGGRDLMATVRSPGNRELMDYVLSRLSLLPGVRSVHTHLFAERILDARRWRLRALTDDEVARVPPPAPPRRRSMRTVADPLRSVIRRELAADGRRPAARIAEVAGVSPQRVLDAIATLRADGQLYLRTDITRGLSQWPIYAWFFLAVPPESMPQVRATMLKVPEVRLAAICASRYNLIVAVWLRSIKDIHLFEVALARSLPGVEVLDRSMVVRIHKHMGRVLDERERATGRVIPLLRADLGAAPTSLARQPG